MSTVNRPLSPHLQVYKPQLTSMMSITHRATGVALTVGTLLLVYWLSAAAMGPAAYADAARVLSSKLGQLILFVWTWALFYHLCNGIRHLYWDMGKGLDLESVYRSGKITLGASVGLTLVTWIIAAP